MHQLGLPHPPLSFSGSVFCSRHFCTSRLWWNVGSGFQRDSWGGKTDISVRRPLISGGEERTRQADTLSSAFLEPFWDGFLVPAGPHMAPIYWLNHRLQLFIASRWSHHPWRCVEKLSPSIFRSPHFLSCPHAYLANEHLSNHHILTFFSGPASSGLGWMQCPMCH